MDDPFRKFIILRLPPKSFSLLAGGHYHFRDKKGHISARIKNSHFLKNPVKSVKFGHLLVSASDLLIRSGFAMPI
jgi:hypothetical protein